MDYIDFENYLSKEEERNNFKIENTNNTEIQKAEKNASLHDLINMISVLVTKSMKKNKVEFSLNEGNRIINDTRKTIDHPYILYKVISREPLLEVKPRIRETISDGKINGEIHGQLFKCNIQFDIIASTPNLVNDIMDKFEDLMYSYQHYFQKNGVRRILFKKHFTDKDCDIYRQSVNVRSLQYYVEIEKIYNTLYSEIEKIDS